VLQLNAEVAQLLDVVAHPLLVALEFGGDLLDFLLVRLAEPVTSVGLQARQALVPFAQVAGQRADVLDDGAGERQSGVGLGDGEIFLRGSGLIIRGHGPTSIISWRQPAQRAARYRASSPRPARPAAWTRPPPSGSGSPAPRRSPGAAWRNR